MINNDVSLIAVLAITSLTPFLIAIGTCYIKFSIVFVMVRNAIGLQQIPSNMALNGIALIMAAFVMMPILQHGYDYYQNNPPNITSSASLNDYLDNGFSDYRDYLVKFSDKDLVSFFEKAKNNNHNDIDIWSDEDETTPSLLVLLPAYALTEIKEAFKIGFYIYLPFVVVDMLISSVLLALGMMMMSPVTISVPIKLLLFVVIDGWSLVSKGLIQQYMSL